VISRLQAAGLNATSVQNPLTSCSKVDPRGKSDAGEGQSQSLRDRRDDDAHDEKGNECAHLYLQAGSRDQRAAWTSIPISIGIGSMRHGMEKNVP